MKTCKASGGPVSAGRTGAAGVSADTSGGYGNLPDKNDYPRGARTGDKKGKRINQYTSTR